MRENFEWEKSEHVQNLTFRFFLPKLQCDVLVVLCRAVEGGLKYKHFSSWNSVLEVLSTFYTALGGNTACQKFMTKVRD